MQSLATDTTLSGDAYLSGSVYNIPHQFYDIPESKVHGANMGPILGRQDPDGPCVDPMNFSICDCIFIWFDILKLYSPNWIVCAILDSRGRFYYHGLT